MVRQCLFFVILYKLVFAFKFEIIRNRPEKYKRNLLGIMQKTYSLPLAVTLSKAELFSRKFS